MDKHIFVTMVAFIVGGTIGYGLHPYNQIALQTPVQSTTHITPNVQMMSSGGGAMSMDEMMTI